jgi:hypothetical protein
MMSADSGGLAGIVDIEFNPPVVPDPPWLMPAAVSVGLLLIIAVLVCWWRSERSRGLDRLRRLQRHCNTQTLTSRQAAFRLAAVLQSALGLSSLSVDTPLPPRLQPQQPRWQHFNRRLANARYARPPPSADDLDQLLREGRYWLRQWLGYWQ